MLNMERKKKGEQSVDSEWIKWRVRKVYNRVAHKNRFLTAIRPYGFYYPRKSYTSFFYLLFFGIYS